MGTNCQPHNILYSLAFGNFISGGEKMVRRDRKIADSNKSFDSRRWRLGVPFWHSTLRTCYCHCSGLGWIPDPRISKCHRHSRKKGRCRLKTKGLQVQSINLSPFYGRPIFLQNKVLFLSREEIIYQAKTGASRHFNHSEVQSISSFFCIWSLHWPPGPQCTPENPSLSPSRHHHLVLIIQDQHDVHSWAAKLRM